MVFIHYCTYYGNNLDDCYHRVLNLHTVVESQKWGAPFVYKGRGGGGGGGISGLRSSGWAFVGGFHPKWSIFGTIVNLGFKT